MRIAVCDDEERFRADIRDHVDRLFGSLDVMVDSYSSAPDLIDKFEKKPYDLVFLDIEMPGMNGIEAARRLRELSDKVYIVFLTGHVEYALEGYEVNALRYLTKPINEDKLKEVVKYVSDKMSDARHIRIRVDGEDIFVNISDIYYFEARDQYVMIYTKDKDYLVRYNLSDYEEELKNDGFYKTHRSYLVSLGKVKKLAKNEAVMEGGGAVPVSRGAASGLKEALYAYLEKNAF